ncbi:hypothetical protein K435DRAFT_332039 [Dendrothele bispora CBS 962.96]|uniref:Uncharacterized protein n=1 Tax=Dendrothele bispora (strain CBS 962.96) TaxID=1314807 RepID=A0A4S8MY20_DENBC|nr:hypothetical protein K435DRAFT_332039 [Dendrothele bispora CBS 962.96]
MFSLTTVCVVLTTRYLFKLFRGHDFTTSPTSPSTLQLAQDYYYFTTSSPPSKHRESSTPRRSYTSNSRTSDVLMRIHSRIYYYRYLTEALLLIVETIPPPQNLVLAPHSVDVSGMHASTVRVHAYGVNNRGSVVQTFMVNSPCSSFVGLH